MFTLLAILAALPRSWLRAALLTLLAAWLALSAPPPALAADGEVLLSQASANSGWPIRITARGRYKLIGSIVVPAGVQCGIQVEYFDVQLDFNGFALLGANGQGYIGVCLRTDSTAVSNGTIAGFQMSAIMNLGTSANYVRVENMRLVKNSYSSTMVTSPQIELGGKGIVIRNNQIVDGQYGGLACGSDCLVQNNLISDNGGVNGVPQHAVGAWVRSGLVQGNVISGHRTGVSCESPCGVGGNMISRSGETWSGPVYLVNPNAIGPAY